MLCSILGLKWETSAHLHSTPFTLRHDSITLESDPAALTLSLQKATGFKQVGFKS